jgi:hypothetical protein
MDIPSLLAIINGFENMCIWISIFLAFIGKSDCPVFLFLSAEWHCSIPYDQFFLKKKAILLLHRFIVSC